MDTFPSSAAVRLSAARVVSVMTVAVAFAWPWLPLGERLEGIADRSSLPPQSRGWQRCGSLWERHPASGI